MIGKSGSIIGKRELRHLPVVPLHKILFKFFLHLKNYLFTIHPLTFCVTSTFSSFYFLLSTFFIFFFYLWPFLCLWFLPLSFSPRLNPSFLPLVFFRSSTQDFVTTQGWEVFWREERDKCNSDLTRKVIRSVSHRERDVRTSPKTPSVPGELRGVSRRLGTVMARYVVYAFGGTTVCKGEVN